MPRGSDGVSGTWRFLSDLFLPEDFPNSVADDYLPFQVWDTVQQVTFFVNTVISMQAYYIFHGVGVPGFTGINSGFLEVARNMLGTLLQLVAAGPMCVKTYKRNPVFFKFFSGLMEAVEHLGEVIAGVAFVFYGTSMFSTSALLLAFMAPAISTFVRPSWSASRYIILQHFAEGGKPHADGKPREPLYGDIHMKENNQDKGGKIVGLAMGAALLQTHVGVHLDGVQESVNFGLTVFLALSIIHVVPLYVSVRQLNLKATASAARVSPNGVAAVPVDQTSGGTKESQNVPETPGAAGGSSTASANSSWVENVFLPPGYPGSLDPQYTKFRVWCLLETLIGGPKAMLESIVSWENVWGVGRPGSTPRSAAELKLFIGCVSAVSGLIAGLPAARDYFHFRDVRWQLWGDLLKCLQQPLRFYAAACLGSSPGGLIGVLMLAEVIGAFAGSASARISGTILPAMIRPGCRGWLKLVDVNMANSNQGRVVQMASGLLTAGLLLVLWQHRIVPSDHLKELASAYVLLHGITVFIQFQKYHALPQLPSVDIDSNDSWKLRVTEVERLGDMGAPWLARHAPALLEALEDSHPRVREASRLVARKLESPLYKPVLSSMCAALIDHPIQDVREYVHQHLNVKLLRRSMDRSTTSARELSPVDDAVIQAWSSSFADAAGGTLDYLVRASSLLRRRGRLERQDDSEAGEAMHVVARSLELIAAALLHTMTGDEVRKLQRSKRGGDAIALAVQRECKLVTAQASVQQAMRSQWSGLQVPFEVVLTSAAMYYALSLPVLVAAIAMPDTLARTVHFPGASLLADGVWQQRLLLWAVLSLGLGPGTALLLFLAKNAGHIGTVGFGLILILCVLANPLSPLVVVAISALLFIIVGAIGPLSQWLSASTDARDTRTWLDGAPILRAVAILFVPMVPLASPRGKFFLSTATRVAFASFLCFLPASVAVNPKTSDTQVPFSISLMASGALWEWNATGTALVWGLALLVDELAELVSNLGFWSADPLNLLELPGLVLAVGGLLYGGGVADGALAGAVACLLSAQGLRLLQLIPSLGPLVLMTLQMVEKDLLKWLMLFLVGVLVPFAAAAFLLYSRALDETRALHEFQGDDDDGCADVALAFSSSFFAASFLLFTAIIGGGEEIIECLGGSALPTAGVAIVGTYLVLSVILLVNLLIALMSKTFDLVYENKDTNYMFLFARLVSSNSNRQILPPPFNVIRVVGWLLEGVYALCTPHGRHIERGTSQGTNFDRLWDDAEDDGNGTNDDIRPMENELWLKRFPIDVANEDGAGTTGAAESEPWPGAGDERQGRSLVGHVREFLFAHEHTDIQVFAGRWRSGFLSMLGTFDRNVDRKLSRMSAMLRDQSAKLDAIEAAGARGAFE